MSLNIEELALKIDHQLSLETKESFEEWLVTKRARELGDKKLIELPFTARALNSFKMVGFTRESDLVNLTEQDLLILKFGKKLS